MRLEKSFTKSNLKRGESKRKERVKFADEIPPFVYTPNAEYFKNLEGQIKQEF
jgi:hypothetical protein